MKEVQHNKIHIVREMIIGNPKKFEHESKEFFWVDITFLTNTMPIRRAERVGVNPNSVYCGTVC